MAASGLLTLLLLAATGAAAAIRQPPTPPPLSVYQRELLANISREACSQGAISPE